MILSLGNQLRDRPFGNMSTYQWGPTSLHWYHKREHSALRLPALEATYEPHKALQSFSQYFQLGDGDASDFLSYNRLLLHMNDQTGAVDALGHALAGCEPSERFEVLVECAHCKARQELSEVLDLGDTRLQMPSTGKDVSLILPTSLYCLHLLPRS